ncbi:(d)CMP kinase [Derxia gummosa]|uniref:Cytidylate kinase n=1 Tax=Derxia gummosa DSM 723 TaxID=1121388 RepID=A0A8B6X990_9BURK|nr:(d)CMP kinase [Derxia gummosa]
MNVPVITIDGPTASGKGTVAVRVGEALGFHVLDSGAMYRLVALSAIRSGVAHDDEAALAALAESLPARFVGDRILLGAVDATDLIRQEAVGNLASKVAVFPAVRDALLARQRAFRTAPGLVADGRDMGTVVFPDAPLKVFLTASVESRAWRRHKQLIDKGFPANIDDLRKDLAERDARDTQRRNAPLRPAEDALHLDSSDMPVADVVGAILGRWTQIQAACGAGTVDAPQAG